MYPISRSWDDLEKPYYQPPPPPPAPTVSQPMQPVQPVQPVQSTFPGYVPAAPMFAGAQQFSASPVVQSGSVPQQVQYANSFGPQYSSLSPVRRRPKRRRRRHSSSKNRRSSSPPRRRRSQSASPTPPVARRNTAAVVGATESTTLSPTIVAFGTVIIALLLGMFIIGIVNVSRSSNRR